MIVFDIETTMADTSVPRTALCDCVKDKRYAGDKY
jgi:hypothetical protein